MNILEKTRAMLSMIPAGGNFRDVPSDSSLYVKGMISHVYRRIDPDQPSKTLIAGGGGGTWGYHYPENRALTNRERARIQSFPDDFVFEGSFTEVRRQIGNAVPPVGMIQVVNSLNPLFSGDFDEIDLRSHLKRLQEIPVSRRIELAKMREPVDWTLAR
jgi:DNA (cytosine-5)-methyltransferase 1